MCIYLHICIDYYNEPNDLFYLYICHAVRRTYKGLGVNGYVVLLYLLTVVAAILLLVVLKLLVFHFGLSEYYRLASLFVFDSILFEN